MYFVGMVRVKFQRLSVNPTVLMEDQTVKTAGGRPYLILAANRLLKDVADFRIKAILTMTGADGYWNSCLDHMDIALTYGITLALFWKGDEMLPQLFQ